MAAGEIDKKRTGQAAETDHQHTEAKKQRRNEASFDVHACFRPGLLDTAGDLAQTFAQSQPYRHAFIERFCNEELLQGVRHEMLERLHFTLKETDILKYHQSGDLANLDGLDEIERRQLPHLQKLRDALYSQEFRDFVSAVTGCGPLSGSRTDMSTNRYKQGDHLLLHDDVIGDRRVSYIIYLPDPAINGGQGWHKEDGGHLEMYPRESDKSWAPAVNPTKRIAPQWNQILFFPVLPGQSHHSVEEVAGAGKERLSIQGWFHFPQPGEPGYAPDQMQKLWAHGEVSTLSQIEAKAQRSAVQPGDAFEPYSEPVDSVSELSASDQTALEKYINPDYLSTKIMAQVADKFADDSSIQLAQFLNAETADALAPLLVQIDEHDGMNGSKIPPHGTGERGQWHAVGSPVVRRYMRLNAPAIANAPEQAVPRNNDDAVRDAEDQASKLLGAVQAELFDSGAFARWLNLVTTLALTARRGMVRRFRSGLDYTLGTPDGSTAVMLDATLALAASQDKWADGVIGGYQCYVDGGDGDEASNDGSVYRRTEEDGILLTTPAAWNTLNLVMREPGVVKFIKYVSAASPGSRWDIAFEYQVQEADDDDE